jgi:methylated-DNA-[protein]-cysteine S-methyltransferase
MDSAGLTLFATAIGHCGVAWRGKVVSATHLPEASDTETIRRLAARAGDPPQTDPPDAIRRAISAMASLLSGERTDLSFIACDFNAVEQLAARIYDVARTIPPGETLTYGAIAERLGDRLLAQAVGRALGRNPFPIIVPCHRVMGAAGKLTGFSAKGGVATKLRMLAIEGATIGEAPGLFGDLPLAVRPRG